MNILIGRIRQDMAIVSTSNNRECSEYGDVGMSFHVRCRQTLAFSFTFSYLFYFILFIFTTCMIFHGIYIYYQVYSVL